MPGGGRLMVNVGTGNLLLQEDDMSVPHKGIALAFRRTYNSQSQHDVNGTDGAVAGVYGNGWTNTFDAHLSASGPGQITVWDIDGAHYDYRRPRLETLLLRQGSRLSNIISLSNYDIFEMSEQMREKPPREWTTAEARAHFDWFLRIKEERIDKIASVSGTRNTISLELKLDRITETIRRSIDNLATSEGDVQNVNGLGLIVGFDAALILGDALAQHIDGAAWRIMMTRMKSFISKNLPVIQRRSLWAFEPFLEGRRALSLIGRETDREHTNVLNTIYRDWLHRLRQEGDLT